MNDTIQKFIELAIIDAQNTEGGNSKKQNKNFDLIQELYEKLKATDNVKILIPLLEHEERYVRLWAATFLLPVDTENSIRVLESLMEEKGFISITAKYTLKEWNRGRLQL